MLRCTIEAFPVPEVTLCSCWPSINIQPSSDGETSNNWQKLPDTSSYTVYKHVITQMGKFNDNKNTTIYCRTACFMVIYTRKKEGSMYITVTSCMHLRCHYQLPVFLHPSWWQWFQHPARGWEGHLLYNHRQVPFFITCSQSLCSGPNRCFFVWYVLSIHKSAPHRVFIGGHLGLQSLNFDNCCSIHH